MALIPRLFYCSDESFRAKYFSVLERENGRFSRLLFQSDCFFFLSSLLQILWAGFDVLEVRKGYKQTVLILEYSEGFQIWNVEESTNVREIVSRRDGPASSFCLLPFPEPVANIQNKDLKGNMQEDFGTYGPLLAMAVPETRRELSTVNEAVLKTVVSFYSLKRHEYVHEMSFGSAVTGIRCNSFVVTVALSAQVSSSVGLFTVCFKFRLTVVSFLRVTDKDFLLCNTGSLFQCSDIPSPMFFPFRITA